MPDDMRKAPNTSKYVLQYMLHKLTSILKMISIQSAQFWAFFSARPTKKIIFLSNFAQFAILSQEKDFCDYRKKSL